MSLTYLYSVILELSADKDAQLPATTGHQAHALFLDLVKQVDPVLATHLHDSPDYRPFTVSPLMGAREHQHKLIVQAGQCYRLRVTLLDGGPLWCYLSNYFLAMHEITLHLGEADFRLQRILSTPSVDSTGWANHTDWQTLATREARRTLTIRFASPCAFSLGDRRFALFPEPTLLWDSLMRTWNLYAPEVLRLEKQAIRECVKQHITVSDYTLQTTMLRFPKFPQKGFVGQCTYALDTQDKYASHIAALAAFSLYSGVGYKTTMGMGQARLEESQ